MKDAVLSVARGAWLAAWLLVRLPGAAVGLVLARRRAVAGFRAGLREMGLPREAVEALARHYPRLTFGLPPADLTSRPRRSSPSRRAGSTGRRRR
ncbi:MAG TPA: hypothetical protein DHW14_03790 [Clostridiales bacterium]|nr:hypothetical protein [Clostridiales bacterium]